MADSAPSSPGVPRPSSASVNAADGSAAPETILPSAAPLATLWLAMPSVQRYAEDFQLEAPCLEADVTALMRNAFRCARTNCDAADADAAVEALQRTLPPVPPLASEPPPLLTGGGEDGSAPEVGTISRAHFEALVTQHVLPAWLPPGAALIQLDRPATAAAASPEKAPAAAAKEGDDSPAAAKKKGKKDADKAAAEKAAAEKAAAAAAAALAAIPRDEVERAAQLEALVEAVVDDRAPRALLPFEQVITMALAKPITVELKAFTRVVTHPAHAPCFDVMWEALGKDEEESSAVPATTTGADEFARWFTHWTVWAAPCMTPARAAVAAKTHWLDATATTGVMGFAEFHAAAVALATLYTRGSEDPTAFFTEYVAAVRKAQAAAGSNVLFYAVSLAGAAARYAADATKAIALERVEDLFATDSLDEPGHERAVSRLPSANRVLVTGLEGCGKKTLARALAARVNAQLVDVFDLALEALDAATLPTAPLSANAAGEDDAGANGDDEGGDAKPAPSAEETEAKEREEAEAAAAAHAKLDPLGLEVKAAVDAEQPVGLDLQARLVQRCLRRPSTIHRGFVFGDLPPVTEPTAHAVDEFVRACGMAEWPTAVVDVRMPAELYASWRNTVRTEKLDAYEQELATRQAEADAVAAKEAAVQAKAEKKAARQAIVDRQAKIDAGEVEPTDEDRAFMEAGGVDSLEPEEEEPEPEPEVDEDGNALEPEQIAARAVAAAAAVERRKLVAELRRQLLAGRFVSVDEKQVGADSIPTLGPILAHCAARDRRVQLASFDDPEACVDYLYERLAMAPSVVPQPPAVPADQLEGIEPGPDGDAQLADLHKTALAEAGMALSPWDGICPVTAKEDGVFVQGSWAFACHFRGFMYCFASQAKLRRFTDAPLPYLLQSPNDGQPVLLLPKTRATLADAGIDAADLEARLAEALGVTAGDLAEYAATWKRYDAEVARRAQLEAAHRAADAKALKARDDRARLAKEGDGKKGKKGAADKKKKKTDKDGDGADGDAAAEQELKAPTPVDDKEPAVLTTEERIQQDIDAAVARRRATNIPHLVSCLRDISRDEILGLLEARKLPEAVVVLEHVRPRRDDEEEEEEPEAEEEEDEGANDEPELDEDGNPVPRKPKTPKPFDADDEKMYRKLIALLLEQFAISPEDDDGGAAAAADAAEDGKPVAAPLPRQTFGVRTVNVFGMTAADLVATVVRQVRPVVERTVVPTDGEELVQDDEEDAAAADEDEANPDAPKPNPLLRPGRKAIHQYGLTLKYCPVTLHESGVLVTGDPANWLSYRGGRYVFVTPEAMERFRLNPDRFLPEVPPRVVAPPRLWLMGVPTSGKRTLAASLTERFGVQPFWLDPAFLVSVIAAATNPNGGTVRGVAIPPTPAGANANLDLAVAIASDLKARDQEEQAQLAAKEKAIAEQAAREEARENGDEEVDDLDEAEEEALQKLLEFEPEEEEAKAERVAREQRRIAAALMRVEPFESRGYVLVGGAPTETDLEQLFEFKAYPEAAISLKLSPEAFVARGCDAELAKREAEHHTQVAAAAAKRRVILRKQRAAEIAKWRRRNIGGGDEADDAEEEELPEDPEAPTMDAVRGDLEATHDTETGNVQAVVALLPERRVPVVEVNADWGFETVLRTTVGALSANLEHRRSMLENPLVVTYDQAQDLVASGRKHLSSFRFTDPVRLRRERAGAPPEVELRPDGRGVEPEEEVPAPEPLPPKPKKMKTITREREEDGEEETVEVTDDEPDEDEADAADAADEEEEPEPEPELSPEELDEMRVEHEAKMRALADKAKPRACVLRNRVYFFDSDENLLAFITRDPLAHWNQPPPPPYASSLVAVVDEEAPAEPATGARRPRAMAHHIAHNMGAVYLDAAKVLKWAARAAKLPSLQRDALAAILAGTVVPDELVTSALACRLLCADVCSRGAVLSNLPRTSAQYNALLANGVTLHKVLVLPPSDPAARSKWKRPSIVDTIDQVALVSATVAAPRFSSAAIVETFEAARRNLRNRQTLAVSRRLAFPARVHDAAQPAQHLRETRSVFKTYCPWTWVREGRLVDSLGATERAVEHCGQQFHFSQDEYVEFFLREPHALSGERGDVRPLPTVLPTVLPRNEAASVRQSDLEHAGCCPVTLHETRARKGLKGVTEPKAVFGSAEHIVAYAGKKYALVDAEAVEKFLRQPWVFVEGAVLPLAHRMPFDKQDLKAQSTELYVKRALYEATARAMLAVSETRPKFPGLSPQESALKFVALHLKANNDANTEHRQNCYAASFAAFAERATLYRDIAGLQPPQDAAELAEFRRRCAAWDEVQDRPDCWRAYQHPAPLTTPPEADAPSQEA